MTAHAAVVGAYETPFTPPGTPGPSYDLSCDAARAAAADAGLRTTELDGIVKYSFDGAISDTELATALGMTALNFSVEVPFGGGSGPAALAVAAAAIQAGLATNILCYRTVVADEWWAQLSQPDHTRPYYRDAKELLRPIGWYSYQHLFGMMTHRHAVEYGTTDREFAEVVVNSRRHARAAPNALIREPLDVETYLAAPYTVQPLRTLDDAVWVNGAAAVVVTSAARAADAPRGAAYVLGSGQSAGSPAQHSFEFWPMRVDLHSSLRQTAASLWRGPVRPSDVGSLHCYDTTPVSTMLALEGLGFCGIGEGGGFVADGGIGPSGTVQVCTNGGHTSSGYLHGFSQVLEAVRRVRPDASGHSADRFSVASGAPTTPTSAVLLGREPA